MTTKKILILCALILIVSVTVEVLFVHPHIDYWWHGFISFDALFGFSGCVAIIVISKFLGKAFIQQKEDYYGGGEDCND